MLFVADTLIGQAFGDFKNHLPELGGAPLNNATRTTGDFQLNADHSTRCTSLTEALVYYPATAPVADYFVQATLTPRNLSNTVVCGIGARWDSATFTGIVLRYETGTSQWRLVSVLNGNPVDDAFDSQTLTIGTPYVARIECVRNVANAFIDGTNILTIPITTIPNAGHAALNAEVLASITPSMDVSIITAGTFISPPTTQQIALFPDSGISALYAPAVGLIKSTLTFYQSARNTVIKDIYADQAWDWIVHNTPPDLIFGNA